MKSPFAIFRKHQKVLMVVLTGLAMFAFVVLDSLGQDRGDLFLPILCGLVGMGLLGYLGWQRGDVIKYGTVGVAVGILIGVLLLRMNPGEKTPVETEMGNLTYQDLQNLIARRQAANNFIARAFEKVSPPLANNLMFAQLWEQQVSERMFGFGRQDINDDVVLGFLLDKEADELGITVSDRTVSDYINRMTSRKLSQSDFAAVLKSMRLTEAEVFKDLRGELRAKMAMEMLVPRAAPTPEKYWADFRKLGVSQTLDVAAVPVDDFLAESPNPSEEQLALYFDAWKGRPAPYPGGPGLLQPRRVQIEQLEADYSEFDKEVAATPITDQEVKKYYEQHREEYRTRPRAGSSSPLDSIINPSGGAGPLFGSPTDGIPKSPAAKTPTTDTKNPKGKSAAPQNPAGSPQKTAPNQKQPDQKKSGSKKEAGKTGARLERQSPEHNHAIAELPYSALRNLPARHLSNRRTHRHRPENAQWSLVAYQSADPKSAPAKPAATSPAAKAPAAPVSSPAVREPEAPPMPEPPSAGAGLRTEPEYKPLDEILQREIRDIILRSRTQAAMKASIQAAYDFLAPLRDRLIPNDAKTPPKTSAEERSKLLSEYAAKHHLKYLLLPPLSGQELQDSTEKYPIGAAAEPVDDPFQRREGIRVIQQLFTSQPDDLYQPFQAEVADSNRFVYWKVADVADHVPTLEEPGVREQAIRGWKIAEHAQKSAKERAEKFAELVRKSKQPMNEALSGQTITKKGPAVVVVPTAPFSWITVQSTAPRDMMPDSTPRLSEITGVTDADNDFMKTVFDEMQVGDVRVVPNLGARILYVVKVKTRHPADEAEKAAFRARFLKENLFSSGMFMGGRTTYEYLNMPEQQQIVTDWAQRLFLKYQVRTNFDETRRTRTRQRPPSAG